MCSQCQVHASGTECPESQSPQGSTPFRLCLEPPPYTSNPPPPYVLGAPPPYSTDVLTVTVTAQISYLSDNPLRYETSTSSTISSDLHGSSPTCGHETACGHGYDLSSSGIFHHYNPCSDNSEVLSATSGTSNITNTAFSDTCGTHQTSHLSQSNIHVHMVQPSPESLAADMLPTTVETLSSLPPHELTLDTQVPPRNCVRTS